MDCLFLYFVFWVWNVTNLYLQQQRLCCAFRWGCDKFHLNRTYMGLLFTRNILLHNYLEKALKKQTSTNLGEVLGGSRGQTCCMVGYCALRCLGTGPKFGGGGVTQGPAKSPSLSVFFQHSLVWTTLAWTTKSLKKHLKVWHKNQHRRIYLWKSGGKKGGDFLNRRRIILTF